LIWRSDTKEWKDISDKVSPLKKIHRSNKGYVTIDWNLDIQFPNPLQPNHIYYLKFVKNCYSYDCPPVDDGRDKILFRSNKDVTLEYVKTDSTPIKFRFTKVGKFEQTFGVSIDYYRSSSGDYFDKQGGRSNRPAGAYLYKSDHNTMY